MKLFHRRTPPAPSPSMTERVSDEEYARRAAERNRIIRERFENGTAGCIDLLMLPYPDGKKSPENCACQQKHIGYEGCCIHTRRGCCCGLFPRKPGLEDVMRRLDELTNALNERETA